MFKIFITVLNLKRIAFKKKTTPLLLKSDVERISVQLGKQAVPRVVEMVTYTSSAFRVIMFPGVLLTWEIDSDFSLVVWGCLGVFLFVWLGFLLFSFLLLFLFGFIHSLETFIFTDMEDITQLCHQMSITVPISGH